MVRLALVLALASAACGTTKDDRPRTIEYVSQAVLAPNCGDAQCHSTFRQSRGDIFDTVAGTRASLVDNGLILFDSVQYDPATPADADLIHWITQIDPDGLGIGRMPYDHPLPNEDVSFLEEYIREGAPGAQCDPARPLSCNNTTLSTCDKSWNFKDPVIDCVGTGNGSACAAGQCLCNPDSDDCDGNPANGCETILDTDANCGGCGAACASGTTCKQGSGGGSVSCQ
jgi:hypothetical protein